MLAHTTYGTRLKNVRILLDSIAKSILFSDTQTKFELILISNMKKIINIFK